MRLSEFPTHFRVKLSPQSEEQLWKEIGSIKHYSEESNYSKTQIYNWKNKDIFYPIDFVNEILPDPDFTAIKAGGSIKWKNPRFPEKIRNELLTRVKNSVSVNKEGVPVYTTSERSLIRRFKQLLHQMGGFPISVYERERFELRYPKMIQDFLSQRYFETDFAALFDEKGVFKQNKMIAGEIQKNIDDFEGTLHSDSKKLELARVKEDEEELEKLLRESIMKAQRLENT